MKSDRILFELHQWCLGMVLEKREPVQTYLDLADVVEFAHAIISTRDRQLTHQWISVKDRLPMEVCKDYVCATDTKWPVISQFTSDREFARKSVTHWLDGVSVPPQEPEKGTK